MKVTTAFKLVLALFIFSLGACKDDDNPSRNDCSNVLETGETLTCDGLTYDIYKTDLTITTIPEADSYFFSVLGIDDDCNTSVGMQFLIQIPENTLLSGSYSIEKFFEAELNDVTNINLVNQTFNPSNISQILVESGSMDITNHGNDEFSVDMNGVLENGTNLALSFRAKF